VPPGGVLEARRDVQVTLEVHVDDLERRDVVAVDEHRLGHVHGGTIGSSQ
jgi:hypothetical protein